MVLRLEGGRLLTVFGGSGFLGRHAVRALAREEWRIRVAVRRPDLAGHLQPMGYVGQIHAVQANVRYPESLQRAVEGADVVVNLVGIPAKSGAQTFEAVHVAGARAVARAAKDAGAKQLVHISALGAERKAISNFWRSKWAGEAAVREHFPGAVILRPAPVFGPEDHLLNRCAELARLWPFLPLVGGGKALLQPVYGADVAAAIATACAGKAIPGTVYELGGPDVMTWRGLFDRAQAWSGRARWYLPLPFALAKLAAILSLPLPQAWRPLTVDEIRRRQRPQVVGKEAHADARTLAGLGLPARAMAGIAPAYLQRFQRRGQFAQVRG
jgi:NADH dehydrogenase